MAVDSKVAEEGELGCHDKRIVDEPGSRNDVWWGSINMPISDDVFSANRSRAVDYLSTCERLYVVDGYAGWDEKYRIKVRVITARPYHAIFMHNMLIRPTAEQLARDFGADFVPDGRSRFVIYNAGAFPADSSMEGAIARGSKTRVALSFERGEMVILGTHYAGEMKKGVFTVMNYLMPKAGALPMHASANEARDGSSSSVFFGLSGTGKTTLSADPKRNLIGDDEIVWSEDGLSNIEGGCYAKTVDLSPVKEPEIFGAVRYGAVLENTVMDASTRVVDYTDTSLTQNTRVSYPIDFIPNAKVPCLGTMPKHIVFLACDAFGVLPPVSKLTPEQAEYHFISGYSAKVAGTEMGVREPVPVFSACFGAPFMVWHPGVYARLLSERMRKHSTSAWLVNTGWSGGAYATGSRMPLAYTRAIIDAINDDKLDAVPTITEPVFGLAIPMDVPGVPTEMLVPRQAWSYPGGGEEYDRTAAKLAGLFVRNFDKYVSGVSEAVLQGGPSAIMLAHEAEAPEQHQQQRMAASL
eukprot:jgi/Mesvir1/21802/Mv04193-RA.1